MDKFSSKDVVHILSDFRLYSGNIRKFNKVYGPFPHNSSIGGIVSTHMDDFNFTVSPMFCDDDCWGIHLPDPCNSLLEGHRRIIYFDVPKLHKNPELIKRYEIANTLYHFYNSFSDRSEAKRLAEQELILGYAGLASYSAVMAAVVRDFRSYSKKRRKLTQREQRLLAKMAKDFKKKA